uniref:Nitroreductase domain-containing protein n=1 Tax=Chromera velia CCMP2878 TaxID=1169474 RepID=A0A0G4FI28_9ALVE|eukprot:Cvel_16970.t1-p1 / transcript=Cvel_16970.t1 / gene=Cvel_16970 / organism=Chromera_velia_CCMP2878 / gene_product=hypothetical protein / transcript_product=hypothetical protein / location=Cvel_scaffold1332:11144-11968(-) / protein_length=275 / sequence_SO=supercontig / SO=protein_coding / is_pseudo=false
MGFSSTLRQYFAGFWSLIFNAKRPVGALVVQTLGGGLLFSALLFRLFIQNVLQTGLTADERNQYEPKQVLPSIRARRSVFPKSYVHRPIEKKVVQSLLEAATWAPFHGPSPPWRFVVLGRAAAVQMQHMSLAFYDANWQHVGWAGGRRGSEAEFLEWRQRTEEEICGRWGPVSFMIAIVMQRQAGSKRMPEWEELAATACAVQNMHIQACSFPGLACYWSSWHSAARDSKEMRAFLRMGEEDKCLGFLMVAACNPELKDTRTRTMDTHMCVEWRD